MLPSPLCWHGRLRQLQSRFAALSERLSAILAFPHVPPSTSRAALERPPGNERKGCAARRCPSAPATFDAEPACRALYRINQVGGRATTDRARDPASRADFARGAGRARRPPLRALLLGAINPVASHRLNSGRISTANALASTAASQHADQHRADRCRSASLGGYIAAGNVTCVACAGRSPADATASPT